MPGREGRGGEGERRHLPGTMRLGWGGRGRLSGLAGWAAVQRGAPRGGRAMCRREGSQSSCSEAAAEQKRRPAKSSPPGPHFKGNRRSGRPGHRGGLRPPPGLPCCRLMSLLAAWPQGCLRSPLLRGGGKGGNNALMCLLSTESISQVSAAPHPLPASLPLSIPASILPFHPSLHLLSVTHTHTHLFVSLLSGFDVNIGCSLRICSASLEESPRGSSESPQLSPSAKPPPQKSLL